MGKTSLLRPVKAAEPYTPPLWYSYTPTVTAGSGSITTASAVGRYVRFNTTICLAVTITVTTNGTGATDVRATLPATAGSTSYFMLQGWNSAGSCVAQIAPGETRAFIYEDNGAYPGADGYTIYFSGMYEAALGGN